MSTGKTRVVVIGAGAAGLGAARWLLDNDLHGMMDITVLEAQDRIGGRVYTASDLAGPANEMALGLFDLGASWLHAHSPENPMSIITETLHSDIVFTNFDDRAVVNIKGKKIISDQAAAVQYNKFESGMEKAVRMARKMKNQQAAAAMNLEQACRQQLGALWNQPVMQGYASDYDFMFGAPLYKCSATESIDEDWLRQEDYDLDFLFPSTGYGSIMDALVSGVATRNSSMQPHLYSSSSSSSSSSSASSGAPGDIKPSSRMNIVTNAAVVAIDQSNNCCRITYRDTRSNEISQIECDAVLVTVSLGVLKSRSIEFTPPLSPAKCDAIDRIGVGNVVKVVIEFPKVFWDTHRTFLHISDPEFSNGDEVGHQRRGFLTTFMNGFAVAKKKILVGYGLGDAADVVDKLSDDQLVEVIMQRIGALRVGGHEAVRPTRIVRSNWGTNPFFCGAYSYNAVVHVRGLRSELGRREGNIWFAGEAVNESSLWHSCVHGAWHSGVNAAADIVQTFNVPMEIPCHFGL